MIISWINRCFNVSYYYARILQILCLAQHTNYPQAEHWFAIKRILRYLSGTFDLALVYTQRVWCTSDPHNFSDADWASTFDHHSYTSYAYLLGGAAISWRFQKQWTIASSSTEAEYVSLLEAVKEAAYLRSLITKSEKLFSLLSILGHYI